MRYLHLFIIISLFGCQSNESEYFYEDRLLECFYHQYEAIGLDAKSKISKIEIIFIKHGVLDSKKGESYVKLIQLMENLDAYPFEISDELIKDLNSVDYLPTSINCTMANDFLEDSAGYQNSKLVYLTGIMDSLALKGDISIRSISEEILEVYDQKDFDHELYKSIGLLALAHHLKNYRKHSLDTPYIY